MTATAVDDGYGADRCADCRAPMPERDIAADTERRCEDCSYRFWTAEYQAGRPIPPVVTPVVVRRLTRKKAR